MKKISIVLLLVAGILGAETILKMIPAPGYSSGYYAYGLAWDGNHLWVGDDYNGMIYEIDTSGNIISSFQGFSSSNHGLAWDGTGLWCAGDYSEDYIVKLTNSGARVDSFPETWDYIGGITFDGNHVWVSVYYPNTPLNLYKVDPQTGNILDTIPSLGTQPQGLAWDGQNIWVVMDDNDGDPEKIWKLDPLTGDTLLSFYIPTTRPRGLVWDGQFLWLIAKHPDEYSGVIFKIDPYGSGTPEITIPLSSYNFGDVVVGDTAFLYLECTNTGTADLTVDSVNLSNPQFFTLSQFPITIPPSETDTILTGFSPQGPGYQTDTLRIFSNDPLHPEKKVFLEGNGVYQGPDIELPDTVLSWGNIRKGASKRKWLTIMNNGNAVLIVDSFKFQTPDFYTTETFPVSINPSSQKSLGLWFFAENSMSYQDTLEIYSNDPDEPVVKVYLSGAGFDTTYSGGEIIWSYNAEGSVWEHIRSIKSIPDVNGDGFEDVVAVSENDTLYLIHGNGYLTGDVLWTFVDAPCYTERGLVISPDLNNDGFNDILLGTVWGSRKVYAISGKDGSVLWMFDTHQYGGGGWVYEVSYTEDLDGDGIVEVLACAGDDGSQTGPRRAFMFSGADGTLLWERLLNYAVFGVRAIGDVTGDGYPDVAAGTADGGSYAYWAYLLDGTVGSVLWSKNMPGAVWTCISIGDIDDDSIPDIAVGLGNGQVKTLSGVDGSEIWTYTTGGIVVELNLLQDADGNGYNEILPAGASISSFVAIDSKTGNHLWVTYSQDAVFSMTEIPDITGDGINDVIGGTGYNVNRVVLLDGSDGSEVWSINRASPVEAVYPIKDIDGNGRYDILAGLRDGNILLIADGGPVNISEREVTFKQKFSVYPNPSNDFLNISLNLKNPEKLKINLYDISGRMVRNLFKGKISKGENLLKFNIKDLSSGIYFIEIKGEKEDKRGFFIKIK